jgi:peptide chain release factor-like protein
MRQRILSVTMADCELQTFTSGGPGGQHQNRSRTGVRIIHKASGARGECREERSQLENKKRAWKRMAEDPKFQLWLRRTLGQELVRESEFQVPAHEVKIEVRRGGRWTQATEDELRRHDQIVAIANVVLERDAELLRRLAL